MTHHYIITIVVALLSLVAPQSIFAAPASASAQVSAPASAPVPAPASAPASAQIDSVTMTAEQLSTRMADLAVKYLGYPYVWAGNGPDCFDCTGFTSYLYRMYGFSIGRTSGAQALDGRQVEGDLSEVQPGDILVFAGSHYRSYFGHAAFCLGMTEDGKGIRFIHASHPGVGVIYGATSNGRYYELLAGVRRIIPDFLPSHVGSSETVDFPFDPTVGAKVESEAKLSVSEGEQAAVLFQNGSWAFMDGEGSLSVSDTGESIALYPDGTWKAVANVDVTVADKAPTSVTPASQRKSSSSGSTSGGGALYHTVKKGDTLSKIAGKYGTSVSKICSLNGINSKTTLQIGRKLRVR